jgi:hypothetical protein
LGRAVANLLMEAGAGALLEAGGDTAGGAAG